MLYDIGFVTLAILSPILVLVAYRQGIKDKIQLAKKEQLKPFFNVPQKPKQSEVDKKYDKLLSDINEYGGE